MWIGMVVSYPDALQKYGDGAWNIHVQHMDILFRFHTIVLWTIKDWFGLTSYLCIKLKYMCTFQCYFVGS